VEICGKKETYAVYMLPVSNVRVILPVERKGLPDLTLSNLCGLDQRKANTKGQGIVLLTLVEWLVYRGSYVDTVEGKSVVAISPKPAFRPVFEVATTRGGSGIVLINETPPDPEGPEAESLCSWCRRGRVELHRERRLVVLLAA